MFNPLIINNYYKDDKKYYDFSNHIPLQSLFYLNNDDYNFYLKRYSKTHIDNYSINLKNIYNQLLDNENYNKITNLITISRYRRYRVRDINTYLYTNIENKIIGYINISLGLMSLNFKNEWLFLLCVKKEYTYYVKLCYFLEKEIEFDCFYILVNPKHIKLSVVNKQVKKISSLILKYCKDYDIEMVLCDNIDLEISKKIKTPSFQAIAGFTNWINDCKNEFKENAIIKEKIKKEIYEELIN